MMDVAGMTGPSWASWATFWKAAGGEPLSDTDLATFERCTGCHRVPAGPLRELYALCGRRAGKSRNAALFALWSAIRRQWSDLLARGELARVPLLAADRRQSRQVLGYVRGLVELPAFAPYVIPGGILRDSVRFTTGATVEVHSATFRLTRGYSMPAAVCDEVCFWRSDELGASPDVEVVNALTPALATLPGSVLACFSTPWSAAGVMFAAFERCYGRDDVDDVLYWRAASAEMNATLNAATIARAYERDAVAAASEFGAEWRRDVTGYVDAQAVAAVTPPGVRERAPVAGLAYSAFADPASGGGADSFTLAIAHRDASGRPVLDVVREARPRFSPEAVVAEYAALLRTYGVSAVTGDRFAAGFASEAFARAGIRYVPSKATASELYRSVLAVINSGGCELLDVPRLTQQLVTLERRAVGAGREVITHPNGSHDDVANSCVGALVLAGAAAARAVLMPWFPGMPQPGRAYQPQPAVGRWPPPHRREPPPSDPAAPGGDE